MAVHRGEVCAHGHDGDVATPSPAPRRDVAGPLVVAATVLLDRLEAECAVIAPERGQFGFDLVGGAAPMGRAASASQMGRFETERQMFTEILSLIARLLLAPMLHCS